MNAYREELTVLVIMVLVTAIAALLVTILQQ
jgi:hypothetical protein